MGSKQGVDNGRISPRKRQEIERRARAVAELMHAQGTHSAVKGLVLAGLLRMAATITDDLRELRREFPALARRARSK